jgi:uncharacterized membrane protein
MASHVRCSSDHRPLAKILPNQGSRLICWASTDLTLPRMFRGARSAGAKPQHPEDCKEKSGRPAMMIAQAEHKLDRESAKVKDIQTKPANPIDGVIASVGSVASLLIHTVVFASFFLAALAGWAPWDQMLLVLTTLLSLEAIYLAIFIQKSVNRQAASLKEVEKDVDIIQENVEDLKEDVGDIQQDVDEISGEIGEDKAEELRKQRQAQMLETLSNDVKAMLKHIEALKAR